MVLDACGKGEIFCLHGPDSAGDCIGSLCGGDPPDFVGAATALHLCECRFLSALFIQHFLNRPDGVQLHGHRVLPFFPACDPGGPGGGEGKKSLPLYSPRRTLPFSIDGDLSGQPRRMYALNPIRPSLPAPARRGERTDKALPCQGDGRGPYRRHPLFPSAETAFVLFPHNAFRLWRRSGSEPLVDPALLPFQLETHLYRGMVLFLQRSLPAEPVSGHRRTCCLSGSAAVVVSGDCADRQAFNQASPPFCLPCAGNTGLCQQLLFPGDQCHDAAADDHPDGADSPALSVVSGRKKDPIFARSRADPEAGVRRLFAWCLYPALRFDLDGGNRFLCHECRKACHDDANGEHHQCVRCQRN